MLVGNLDLVPLGGSSGSVGSLSASAAQNHVGTTDLADLSPMSGASARTVPLCCVCSLLLSSSSRWPGLVHMVTGFKEGEVCTKPFVAQAQNVPYCIHSMGQSRAWHQHKFKGWRSRAPLFIVREEFVVIFVITYLVIWSVHIRNFIQLY